MRILSYTVEDNQEMSVQDYLYSIHGYSRRIITRLKQTRGDIQLNGEHIRMIDPVHAGDIITVRLYEKTYIQPNAELYVQVVYEDEDVIIYNKPPHMPVHPSRNHQHDTLANAFAQLMHTRGVQATFRPINRLDRDTSGLCVVAKNALAASKLAQCVLKEYTAIVHGHITPRQGTIDLPIIRLDEFYIKRAVGENGQQAITHYNVELCTEKYSLVRIKLETGRTHQIRVHFSHIGHPLAGDDMYGGSTDNIKRQALCCNRVSFPHTITGEQICLSVNLHDDMASLMCKAEEC